MKTAFRKMWHKHVIRDTDDLYVGKARKCETKTFQFFNVLT